MTYRATPPGGPAEPERAETENTMIFFTESDRLRGREYAEAAQRLLDDPNTTREQLQATYDHLNAWHETFHSRNRPPDLPCTGCAVWPVVSDLRFDLLVYRDDVPRIVGSERRAAQKRLLDAIRRGPDDEDEPEPGSSSPPVH